MTKRSIVILILGLLFLSINVVLASASSLCDYTPPKSMYSALSMNINYRYFDDQLKSPQGDANTGNLNLRYASLLSSPSWGYNLNFRSGITYNKGDLSYGINGEARYNMYLSEADYFAFGGVSAEAADVYEALGLNVTLGSGYGRFRDVTPLAKSMKINEMLLDRGAITGNLSDDTLMSIAQEIGKKVEYEDVKDLVRAIEGLIEGSGLVKDEQLGAIETLRIREIIEETGDRRLCGWEVKGGLGYELLDPRGQKQDFITNASFNYAQPFDLYSQFRANLDFTSSFNIQENYSLTGFLEYVYRVSETIDTEITYFYRQQVHEGENGRFDSHDLDMSIIFNPQDNLNIRVSLSSSWETGYEEWTKGLSVGVSYNLS